MSYLNLNKMSTKYIVDSFMVKEIEGSGRSTLNGYGYSYGSACGRGDSMGEYFIISEAGMRISNYSLGGIYIDPCMLNDS